MERRILACIGGQYAHTRRLIDGREIREGKQRFSQPGGGAKPSDNARRMFPYRFLAIAGLLAMLLGGVYTAAGQDNAESAPRYITISVSGPSRLVVGGLGAYSISTNAAGDGYSWVVRTSSSALSDSSGCTGSGSWTGSPSSVKVYACKPGYASVKAKLYFTDEDSGTIQLIDSDSQGVRILNPPPPPPPTNTPTPTATLTPRPPVLTGLHDRASAIDIDALRTGEKIGKIYLDWSDAAGIGITYEVEHRVKRVPLLPVYGWHPLPHRDIKIVFNRGPGIITGAVISGLDYDHTYKHRIRAKRGSQYSGWVEIETKVPLPNLGHAGDHTVKYQLGAIPTPRPGATPSTDPGIVIPTAIAQAVVAWNEAVATPWPHVLFCEGSGCTINGVDRNTDGRSIVINTEFGTRERGIAHVKPPFSDALEHISAPIMIIEVPARRRHPYAPGRTLTLVWVNDPDMHNKEVGGNRNRRYYYAPRTIMHEFGHAAGLEDLYLLECGLLGCGYGDYIMGRAEKPTAIPNEDRDYLRDVYYNHTPHPASSGQ